MADTKVTDLTELTTPADDDLVHIIDTSDTTMSAEGTNKKITYANLGSGTQTLTNKTLTSNTNTVYPSTGIGARAYRATTAQSITDITWTKIQLNAETYDVGSDFDSTTNYRFTAPVTGYYQVNASVMISIPIANQRFLTAIYKDGANVADNYGIAATTDSLSLPISDVIYLAENSYVELYAWQNSGVNKDMAAASTHTFMSVHLLSI